MTLENVKKELLQEAKKEAQRLKQDAEKEVDLINKKVKEEITACRKEAQHHAEELLKENKRKTMAAAQFDALRLRSAAKKEIIGRLIEKTRKKLLSLSEKERREWLQKLLEKAKKEIAVATIYLAPQDLNLLKENVKVRETTISGGLIAESEEGQVRVNLSVEELLQTLQEEKTMELSEVLFGQE
ncbi:hypothetical protein J4421_02320 [Candidatus Woesearchaeota archaeon]|nr:hypothetical protein [Candidatus Woesearchaeota archaeon]